MSIGHRRRRCRRGSSFASTHLVSALVGAWLRHYVELLVEGDIGQVHSSYCIRQPQSSQRSNITLVREALRSGRAVKAAAPPPC